MGATAEPAELHDILALVSARCRVDFRDYRREGIVNGLSTRLAATGDADVAAYRARLAVEPTEIDALARAFVVPVSGFFRDREVFAALREVVLPGLVRRMGASSLLRAWSAGTSTGEEAWSTAALLEERRLAWELVDYDLIATDIDAASLAVARRGSYPVAVLPAMRGFEVCEGMAGPGPGVRVRVRFAHHDLVGRMTAPREAVVASFHLILCRNVLIYFDRRLQEKAMARLHRALVPGGVLVVGAVESLPGSFVGELRPFPELAPRLKIFERVA